MNKETESVLFQPRPKDKRTLKFFLSGLRSRAILLVLPAIIPLLGLAIYSYFDQCERAMHELQRNELVAARNLATTQKIVLQDSKKMLMTLAQMPEVQRRDREACRDESAVGLCANLGKLAIENKH